MKVPPGTEQDGAALNWAPDIKPVIMCMACRQQFSEPLDKCPNCHISVSHVRMCPDCGRLVSAFHSKCIYCSRSFLVASDDPAGQVEASPQPALQTPRRWKKAGHLAVSAIVFLLVFSGLVYLTNKHRKPIAPELHKIATAYALRRASIYSSASLTGAAIGHLNPAAVVDVMAFPRAGSTERWLRIKSPALGGYAAMQDFSPPQPLAAEEGYELLRSVLLAIDDPNVMPLADDAVTYYEHAFPTSPHCEELALLVAQGARRLSEHSAVRMVPLAKKRYREVAEHNGLLADDARKQLAELRDVQPSGGMRQKRRSASEIKILGGSLRPASTSAHRMIILQPSEVIVRVTQWPKAAVGTIFPAQTAREIRTDHDIAVPAGSECLLKVLKLTRTDSSGGKIAATLQLIGLDVGTRKIVVNANPLQVSLGNDAGTSTELLKFKINSSLVISD
jgi:hypothetical protein